MKIGLLNFKDWIILDKWVGLTQKIETGFSPESSADENADD